MHLTSHITHSNGYAPCIAYYRSNGVDQLFRKLKPKPKLNPPNAHRSPIKICEKWHTHNVQFPFMPNAFRILKPIQKSSKRVWVFHNTGANAFAKNQMRLAYEDKRDLYCTLLGWRPYYNLKLKYDVSWTWMDLKIAIFGPMGIYLSAFKFIVKYWYYPCWCKFYTHKITLPTFSKISLASLVVLVEHLVKFE